MTRAMLSMTTEPNPDCVPSVAWFKTRKGREYLKYDNKSHGSPHGMNSELFWEIKQTFSDKYGVKFDNFSYIL